MREHILRPKRECAVIESQLVEHPQLAKKGVEQQHAQISCNLFGEVLGTIVERCVVGQQDIDSLSQRSLKIA